MHSVHFVLISSLSALVRAGVTQPSRPAARHLLPVRHLHKCKWFQTFSGGLGHDWGIPRHDWGIPRPRRQKSTLSSYFP